VTKAAELSLLDVIVFGLAGCFPLQLGQNLYLQ
jgi:hypothetical protein